MPPARTAAASPARAPAPARPAASRAPGPTPAPPVSPVVQAARVGGGGPAVRLGGGGAGGAAGGAAAQPAVGAALQAGEVDLSAGQFTVAEEVAATVKDGGELEVPVRLPRLAEGKVKVRRKGDTWSSVGSGHAITLRHPALAGLAAQTPTTLAVVVKEGVVTGWVGVGAPGPIRGGKRALLDTIARGPDALGWLGLSKVKIPAFRNDFNGGVLDLAVDNLGFTVGQFLDGTARVALDNAGLTFEGSARVDIPGGSGGDLLIRKDPRGALAGTLKVMVRVGGLSGSVAATLVNGFVSVMGTVGYSGDRLSGSVTLVATDEKTARDVTLAPPGGGQPPIQLPGPDNPPAPGKRAFAGWGDLQFAVTPWLTGTAQVLVNHLGQATIYGEITPPKEFILFDQKEWIKNLVKFEVRAGYGIPVIGQVGLFANIKLDALAKIGPGKLYNIKLSGAYSTDPRVTQELSIQGSINISAFAGLRLRAEAGLVLTVLGHDLKAGVGLNAIAGVRGYVEATPKIGMRKAPGQPAQFYIQGHMEIAAQPVLGFSGDLFVEIDSPWWSPLPDKKWTWPLFSIEYPLPGEFGIGADVNYILGSKQWPEIQFSDVAFDGSKFMTDVMNDNTDEGGGGEEKKEGTWKEGSGGKLGNAKNKGGAGKKPGDPGYDSDPVGEEVSFSDGEESHRLWFKEGAGTATLMVASNESKVPALLGEKEKKVDFLLKGDRARARSLIAAARALLPSIDDESRQVAALKEAEQRAEAAYKKHGKGKGKKKKPKSSRKDINKKLKGEERKLSTVLKDLLVLTRMEAWRRKEKPAQWSAEVRGEGVTGKETIALVGGGKAPRLDIGKQRAVDVIKNVAKGPVGQAKNPAGLSATNAAGDRIDTQLKVIDEVPLDGSKVQARAVPVLEKCLDKIPPAISKLGETLRVKNLNAALSIRNMKPMWPVLFQIRPRKSRTYDASFHTEMRTQLDDQQARLNELTVDGWITRIDTYKSKFYSVFINLDANARRAVAAEIRERLAEFQKTGGTEVALLTIANDNLADFVKKNGPYGKLNAKQKKTYGRYYHLLQEAKKIGPARVALQAFMDLHPDLARLTTAEKHEFHRLSTEAMVVGRSGQEKEFAKLHEEGIKEVANDAAVLARWKTLFSWGSSKHALLHNPDQVAGGHGTIADLDPVKRPTLPAAPNDADLLKYQADLKLWEDYKQKLSAFIGQKWINSIIGGHWGNKIPSLRKEVASKENYPPPLFGLWRMRLKLSHTPAK